MTPIIRRRVFILMTLLLLLASILRFYYLDHQSLWNDEGNSARLSERSVRLIIEGTASDVHPPLYYLLLSTWQQITGNSEFSLRTLSVLFGVMLVAVTYALGRQLLGPLGRLPASAGAFLTVLNPALIYYSQEVRMYELLAFIAILTTWLLVRILQRDPWSNRILVAYVLISAAGLYTHYFYPAVLVVQNLIFLIWLLRKFSDVQSGIRGNELRRFLSSHVLKWFLVMATVFLLYLPWIPIFIRQTGGRDYPRIALPEFLLDGFQWLTYGSTAVPDEVRWPFLAYAILTAVGVVAGWRIIRYHLSYGITLVTALLAPLLLLWFSGATQPPFYKFMLVAAPPLCLLAGSGWYWMWNQYRPSLRWGKPNLSGAACAVQAGIALALILMIIWGSIRALENMYYDPAYGRSDYRSIAAQIAAEDHPNAGIILNAANQWEVFTYYHRPGSDLPAKSGNDVDSPAPVYPIPTYYPDPARIDAELRQIAARHDRLYAVFWGESLRDPQRLVERWLDENAFKARDEWIGDVRFLTYSTADVAGEPDRIPAGLPFGDHIHLNAYILSSSSPSPGAILQITLFWQTDQVLDERYKVFLHLVGDNGQILSQNDSEPGSGLRPTSIWQPLTEQVDNHGLLIPEDLPPGKYSLFMGLYELGNPTQRLLVIVNGTAMDSFELGQIAVK